MDPLREHQHHADDAACPGVVQEMFVCLLGYWCVVVLYCFMFV